MQLGFIGAGLMSLPMIENLLDDGHTIDVWNRTQGKADRLADRGARVVNRPADVCTAGGVVLSCLADDASLDGVFADGSVVAALDQGGVHVCMSTISAECSRRLASAHAAAGAVYLAAPIIGRPDAVKARAQQFLIAGEAQAKARVNELLSSLGRRVFDFGPEPSAANVAKINFNFLIASAIEALCEAFAVVEKSGLDPKLFYEMLLGSPFACPLYENYGRMISQRNWDRPLFKLSLGLKDVGLATSAAAACGARMRLGELLEARFSEAVQHGWGDKDWTAVGIDIRAEAGLGA
jgi:3-hydroxyisobutyrate dehydrogenase-like beta-hydroxyacid dehydrogenase